MKRSEITSEFALRLKSEYECGNSANYLGKKYGLPGDIVGVILRSIGVSFNPKRTKKFINLILVDKGKFIEDYLNLLVPIDEIAHKYKVCRETVMKYAKRFNLKRQTGKIIFAENMEKFIKILSLMDDNSSGMFYNSLTQKQRRAFELRYNITSEGFLTLQEIGDKLNVTRERVRQLIVKVERKAQHLTSRKIVELNSTYIIKSTLKKESNTESIDYGTEDDIINARIELLDLSVRAYNALVRGGITHVKDLVAKWNNLLAIRNLGYVSTKEIESKLANVGINVKQQGGYDHV
jgi:predicted DNA-binding protein YlxM (UPF0122 family)